jgi:hypothetical protein
VIEALRFPKTVNGRSRGDERRERVAVDERRRRDAYRVVDVRDGRRCRVCRASVTPGAVDGRQRAEHHHLEYRSRGGQHESRNVVLLCARCHDEIHVRAILRLSGDADVRDTVGLLAGVRVERLREHGWEVSTWV